LKGKALLRRAVERLSDVDLDRALEAARDRRFIAAERIIAAAAPPSVRGVSTRPTSNRCGTVPREETP
jgi:hypothetical protein